mmetsp:Transcript_42496/g.77117  ORF Transcript_42496/g.77117 Transcript_42496/m.77117 type:complete len:218 (+) Transcript_42496:289-942(+)
MASSATSMQTPGCPCGGGGGGLGKAALSAGPILIARIRPIKMLLGLVPPVRGPIATTFSCTASDSERNANAAPASSLLSYTNLSISEPLTTPGLMSGTLSRAGCEAAILFASTTASPCEYLQASPLLHTPRLKSLQGSKAVFKPGTANGGGSTFATLGRLLVCLASLMRLIKAPLGLEQCSKRPLSRTTNCTATGSFRSSRAAGGSILFSTMKPSMS